jgi:hypothetical protein
LWRLPLIKPYELRNLRNSDSTQPATYGWELNFFQKTEYVGDLFSRVNKVNIRKKMIYGYGKGVYKDYFVIDMQVNKEYFFENRDEWNRFLIKHQIDPGSVLNVGMCFMNFIEMLHCHGKVKFPP